MLARIKNRYAGYRHVLVGADFHAEGGAWRSIHAYYKYLGEAGEPVLLVDLQRGDGWKRWFCSLLFAPRIVVNGMSAAMRWRVLLGLSLRPDAAVYLHDTGYMLDALQREKPLTYRCLARLLRNRPVLCVSDQMAHLYRERFVSRNAAVVYEVIELDPEPVLDPQKVHVVMVGSLNRRKGYPLFVATAELAASRGLPWQFHWIGGLGEADLAHVSNSITWWGWRNSAASIVKQADIFFLASVDDPQPLACLEALALGKRVVAYSGTGSSEVILGLQGCRIFDEHTVDLAFTALSEALEEQPDVEAIKAAVTKFAGVGEFSKRIQSVFAS